MSNTVRVWVVFDKDSAGLSTLDARGKLIVINGIKQIGTVVPDKYSLSQNYPNPFNNTSNLKFEIGKANANAFANLGEVKLVVYDVMGREVQTLVNERLQPGSYETTFDGSNFSSGVYFYKLMTEDFSETKRMFLIK